ncbi:MAG: hypothetical protein R3B06_04450 [Kofleriaceae bacterium]
MATVEVGIRIDLATGISFFGIEEVNQRIAAGGRVLEVRPGGAVMTQAAGADDEGSDTVRVTLGGCQLQVLFEDA